MMKLYNALFIFCGTSIGPYFFSKFGEGLNTYGVKLSILSLMVAGFVMYKVMQLVSDLSSIKNVHSLYDITYALLPRYAVYLAGMYVVLGMFVVGYYSFVVVGIGAQYGLSTFTSFCLLFSLFVVSTLNRDVLIRGDTFFNSLKLFLMVVFWVGCVVLLCKTGFAHQDTTAVTTPFSLSKLSSAFFLAGVFLIGMEGVVHAKSDMKEKTIEKQRF